MDNIQKMIDVSVQGKEHENYQLALDNLLKAAIRMRDKRYELAKEKTFEEAHKRAPKDKETCESIWSLSV